jgi:hypothetical protein
MGPTAPHVLSFFFWSFIPPYPLSPSYPRRRKLWQEPELEHQLAPVAAPPPGRGTRRGGGRTAARRQRDGMGSWAACGRRANCFFCVDARAELVADFLPAHYLRRFRRSPPMRPQSGRRRQGQQGRGPHGRRRSRARGGQACVLHPVPSQASLRKMLLRLP